MTNIAFRILSIGNQSQEMSEMSMLVTFFSGAPSELADFCHILERKEVAKFVKKGSIISFDKEPYTVTSLGTVAGENFKNLGHVTFIFDAAQTPQLEGAVHLTGAAGIPTLHPNSTIELCL